MGVVPAVLLGTCLTPLPSASEGPLELLQILIKHAFSCCASKFMAETTQPPELSALEKRVLLLVSIVAAGGAEQRREADRDHKPTGICTKHSKVELRKICIFIR